VVGAATAFYEYNEVDRLTLEEHTLEVPRWDADGIKIGLISDLHITNQHEADRSVRAAQMAVEQKPAFLLICGDFTYNGWEENSGAFAEALDKIANLGVPVLAVLGNHDYWVEDPAAVITTVRQSGIRLLRNQLVEIDGVKIAGIDDGVAGRDRHDFQGPSSDRNTITLFHEPDFVDRCVKGSSIMLAGHSHGGQIKAPFMWRRFLPYGGREHVEGFYPEAFLPLYVGRGVGTVGLKARAFCPPEVTILTLKGRGE